MKPALTDLGLRAAYVLMKNDGRVNSELTTISKDQNCSAASFVGV